MVRTTPQERQALGVTALLLAAGAGVRLFAAPEAPFRWDGVASDTVVAGELAVVKAGAAAELEREEIRRKPLAPGERIDPNRADALQLDRLPRVGAALADRIVERRTLRGPFRSLADLDSVEGVGPALLAQLAPHLTLPAAPARPPRREAASAGRDAGASEASAPAGPLNVNRASAAELEALP